jgi:hypothetical protein
MRLSRVMLCAAVIAVVGTLTACGGGNGGSSSSGGNSGGNNPPPPANTDIVYTFTGGNPAAVATQIGTGAWTAGTAPTNNQFTVSIPSGTTNYGLAYVCPAFNNEFIDWEQITEATVADGTAFTVSCNPPASSLGTATANVDLNSPFGLLDNTMVYGAQGSSTVGTTPIPRTNFTEFEFSAPVGRNDIAVVGGNFQTAAVKLFRDQTVPGQVNGDNTIIFVPTDAVGFRPYEVHNVPSGFDSPSVYSSYTTANGTTIQLYAGNAVQYPVLPADIAAQPGEFYLLSASAFTHPEGGYQSVGQNVSIASPASMNFKLPVPLPYAAPAAAPWPSFSIKYGGFSGVAASDTTVSIQWIVDKGPDNYVGVSATSAYLNNATTLTIPDLSSFTGFLQAPKAGTSVFWQVGIEGGDYHSFVVTPSTGSIQGAWCGGNYTVP